MCQSATFVSRMTKMLVRFDFFVVFFSLFQMVEMVCLHVISLMEALQECNSTIFVKVRRYTTFQKKRQLKRPQDESQQSFFFLLFSADPHVAANDSSKPKSKKQEVSTIAEQ